MTARTFDELFDPPIRLSLEQQGRNYIVCDGDTVYLRSPDLELCKRFMVAMQAKRQAVIDMDSYHWFWALGQHSVRVGALPERGFAVEAGRTDLTGDITGSDHVPVPPRSESASNVYRLRPAENERTAS